MNKKLKDNTSLSALKWWSRRPVICSITVELLSLVWSDKWARASHRAVAVRHRGVPAAAAAQGSCPCPTENHQDNAPGCREPSAAPVQVSPTTASLVLLSFWPGGNFPLEASVQNALCGVFRVHSMWHARDGALLQPRSRWRWAGEMRLRWNAERTHTERKWIKH